MGNPEGKIFERQTKATLEVKTRHFVTAFEGGYINEKCSIDQIPPKLFAVEQYLLDLTYLNFFCLIISLKMRPLAAESLILTGGQCFTTFGSHVSNLLPTGFMYIKEQLYRRWLT